LVLALATLVVFKLWLVQSETIVGSATQYDALWYLRSARHWYWGATYDWIAFLRPCAYPLWIATVHLLHIPLRLAIELLQLGGALTLVLAFRGLGVNRWFCVASFALICLHPIGFQQNNYTMADTFYAGLLWYVLGGLLLTLAGRSLWISFATGIAIAILWDTREEGIVLLALVPIASALLFFKGKSPDTSIRQALGRSGPPIAVMCATALSLIVVTYAANDIVFRSFARSEMTAPVFQSFYHSLLRIKPAEAKPYAPITTNTLQRAFAVSPTLAKLRASLDGPLGESWRVETYRRVGTPNEIGVGWIVWATRQAAAGEGIFASPKTARRFFTKATGEINQACNEGRLPTRFVLDGFLDPFTQSGARFRLPASVRRVAARVFARWTIGPISDDTILTKEEAQLYDQMTLRHSSGVEPRKGAAVFVETMISRYHWVAMILLHAFAVGALIYLLLSERRPKADRGITCAIVLLASAVFLRAALLAWLDATAFDATQDRFLFPILPLWSVVLVLIIALGTKAMGRMRTHKTDER
jgi:hypothetical protein